MNLRKIVSTLSMLLALTGAAQAADIVVIGNPSAAPLTKDQVADVFLGKSQSSVPVDQLESAPIRAEFYKKATGRDQAQIKALWSRLVFSGKAQPPKEVADSGAVKKAVAADPKAIGYIEKSAVDGSVKVLTAVE
ncbi:hypothetical protein [Aquabacterium sp.]|uniref:hypothetical protein n=1 Tax=Aquabacterium sp. TaxID=1872578 RepID=UPI003D6D9029